MSHLYLRSPFAEMFPEVCPTTQPEFRVRRLRDQAEQRRGLAEECLSSRSPLTISQMVSVVSGGDLFHFVCFPPPHGC